LTALALWGALPCSASAYDHQVTLDVAAGWALAPALKAAPDNGPVAGVGATVGFGDGGGAGAYAQWAVHPPFQGGSTFQTGLFGVEGLYTIDILQIVPILGIGVDALPSSDGSVWRADFAAHLRLSVDYLLSRDVIIGLDVRPYVLLTALDQDPVYVTVMGRVSFPFDY